LSPPLEQRTRNTRQLCGFVERTDRASIPADVAMRARVHVLDTAGVTIAGAETRAGRIVGSYVAALGASGGASLFAHHTRTAAQHAALAHGVMGHALDYDDYTVKSMLGHPSVVVLPAALAIAEEEGASGSDLLLAFVLGVEVACKLGDLFNPSLFQRGWPATCVLGTFGATAAAAKLLGLEGETLQNAFGIAGSEASGLKANVGTMTKPFHAGRAAENGVLAARLAAAGYDATADILDVEEGFADVFAVEASPAGLAGLGEPYDFVDPGIALKPFPSCGATHSGIEAALELAADPQIEVGQIRSIVCEVAPHTANVLVFSRPTTGLEGKFSMEYCVAAALLRGRPAIADFSDEAVADPAVKELIERIEVVLDPELGQQGYMSNAAPVGTRIKVELEGGEKVELNVARPGWDGDSPPPIDQVGEKFAACVEGLMPAERGAELAGALLNLDEVADVRELGELLRGTK
jgi:2-methylcitrate dehydratase PrpD